MLDVPHHNPHVDFYQPHQTALYYVNDSDGDTVIFNETFDDLTVEQAAKYADENKFTIKQRISPKKGKMALIDGKYYHASMHPIRASSRIVITFNFVCDRRSASGPAAVDQQRRAGYQSRRG